ncbi:uncharacterized protein LOC122864555 [Siniperca chuatsi]|uniref:uncharacterized protein LOC122864555 n=1 Tax=Siniperca chuatsi TaxID=119488 RepID=UPI001CE12670|nr:uncharacterized protein LOC122864555 [Siniperca chuatsi]
MDVFETLGIKIPNAVLVDGAIDSSLCDDVIEFLEQHGEISRKVTINETKSEFFGRVVVEFMSGSALVKVSPLPYTFTSETGNKLCIESLSDIYASRLCGSKTQSYLSELKSVAKLSGKQYAEVLQDMMAQINQSIAEFHCPEAAEPANPLQSTVNVPIKQSESPSAVPSSSRSTFERMTQNSENREGRSTIHMAPSDLNPPEVQRYVVEHVVRSVDNSLHYHPSHRLRTFSGKVPRPAHETDYDTWQSGVELLLKDPTISNLQRTRFIRDSLLPPAADMVKHLNPDTAPEVYLQQLESAYGTVQDGDELYAKFLDTYQDAGEKPSTYLQRLQVSLQHVVKRGGVPGRDVNKCLLTQFCRGCWDNNLIVELQLKQKKSNPPSFAEFLMLLRTEEDQDAAKSVRMKQHLGTKQKVGSNAQLVHKEESNLCAALTTLTNTVN